MPRPEKVRLGEILLQQGLLTGQIANMSREELVENIVAETKLALSVALKEAGETA